MMSKLKKLSSIFVITLTFIASATSALAQDADDPITAQQFEGLKKEAAHGVVGAQIGLANMYYKSAIVINDTGGVKGIYIHRDNKTALEYFRQAAEGGDPVAQAYVGFFYDRGMVVHRDYKEALRWYEMAAAQGYPRAQDLIGRMYRDGHGVTQDYMLAAQFFEKAALQYTISNIHLARLYITGGPRLHQDYEKAFFWLTLPENPGWRKLHKRLADDLCCESEDSSHSYYDQVKSHLTAAQIKEVQKQVNDYKMPAPTKWSPPDVKKTIELLNEISKKTTHSDQTLSQPNNLQR